jgi:TolB protein
VAPGTGGQAFRLTTSGPEAAESSPTWSPTGSRLAFVSSASGSPQVYTRDLPIGDPVQITSGGAHTDPAWHPSRPLLAYAAARGGRTDLYLLDLGTGLETRLTDRAEDDIRPAWISEEELVYVSRVGAALTLRRLALDAPGASSLIELPGGGQPGHPTGVH